MFNVIFSYDVKQNFDNISILFTLKGVIPQHDFLSETPTQ